MSGLAEIEQIGTYYSGWHEFIVVRFAGVSSGGP